MVEQHPDFLRSPASACQPDARTEAFGVFPRSLEDQHRAVAPLVLHSGVPERIRIQFETTKNLYLYAWFVYRFYPVAHHHAYTVLELALRERFEADLLAEARITFEKRGKELPRHFRPTLSRLLKFVVDKGYVKNENFEVWRHQVLINARQRSLYESLEEMKRLGLKQMEFDETRVEIKDVDQDYDYVATLLKTMPYLRNAYAHGSTMLHNGSIAAIRAVAEFINQIYPAPQK